MARLTKCGWETMHHTTNNNAADFLLDGDAYFRRVHENLRDLLAAPAAANSYVRMAFWEFSHEAYLPSYTTGGGAHVPGCLLKDLLFDIADKGHIIQLIAWYGTWAVRRFAAEMKTNQKLQTWVTQTNTAHNNVGTYRNIQAYLEQYGGNVTGCSTHQKIVIVSITGAKQAFVGGENMSQHYLSESTHNYKNWWHDTAVRVRGPVVDDIEGEWVRRWRKQNANGPLPNTAVGIAQANAGTLSIRMATTNVEANPVETSIRDQMILRIQNAQNLIYLENYALTDPILINALAARLRGANPPTVIILVNNPAATSLPQDFSPFSYLMFYTYAELALIDCQSFSAVDTWRAWITRTPNVYLNANVQNPVMRKLGLNPNTMASFNPVNAFRYDYTYNATDKKVWLRNLWDITTNVNVMYAPQSNHPGGNKWPYPHSKLAIFDDDFLVVGTSNWTYRSMQYDGEITLMIHDTAIAPNFVTTARDDLFEHWNQNNGFAGWSADADQNIVDFTNNAVPLEEVRIVPLRMTDFIHPASAKAWKKIVSTVGAAASAYL